MGEKRGREKVGEGSGEGAAWCRLHLGFRSKPLSFL